MPKVTNQKPDRDSKDALLYAKLTADSGYQSEETHRVSPNQWERIVAIMNEPA